MDSKPDFSPLFPFAAGDPRAAALRAEEERANARRLELESQSSNVHDARERIQIWERLHALRLPASAVHPLVAVIAEHTHLEIRDITGEQKRRRLLGTPTASPPANPVASVTPPPAVDSVQ
jgi:hypothetical protein